MAGMTTKMCRVGGAWAWLVAIASLGAGALGAAE